MTDARILTEYVEATSANSAPGRQLGTLYIETVTMSNPNRQLDTLYVEAAANNSSPPRQLATLYIEVLTPSHRKFRGWGVPL